MLTAAEPTVMGTLSRSVIHNVIRRNEAQIRECYDTHADDQTPKPSGAVGVKFVIGDTRDESFRVPPDTFLEEVLAIDDMRVLRAPDCGMTVPPGKQR